MRRVAFALSFAAVAAAALPARADDSEKTDEARVEALKRLEVKEKPPEATPESEQGTGEAPPLAPPPKPYAKSLVLDTSVGAMVPMGAFRHVAPPSPWLRLTAGWELLEWLMVFGTGELALSDTSVAQDQPNTRAFPIFGFGTGVRFTVRFGRFGIYAQPELGMMSADIADGALRLVGFSKAEHFGVYGGGRLGFEWYQIDRHFALGTSVGVRDAFNFKHDRQSDTPLIADASLAVRYAF